MRKVLLGAAILIVGWFALKDWAYTTLQGSSDQTPEAPDYYFEEVWLARPDTPTSGGWEEPWGVDLFLIAPPVSTAMPKGAIAADSDVLKKEYAELVRDLGLTAEDLTIYAPSYRSPSPASSKRERDEEIKFAQDDIAAAMKRYLSTDNRLRGLVILAAPDTEPMLYAALQQLPKSQEFRKRFGGVLMPSRKDESRWNDFIGTCSPAFEACAKATSLVGSGNNLGWLLPKLPRRTLSYTGEPDLADNIAARMEALSSWLDLNAEKPAEPFDTWAADEVVDVAPIHRPNGDEDISGERGD